MELDDFKKNKRKDHAAISDNVSGYEERIDDLIVLFKTDQKKQRRRSILWIFILIVLALLYLSASGRQDGIANLGQVMIGTGFILGSLYLYFRYKPLSPFNYSLSVVEFLTKAELKLNYLNLIDWLVIIPLLLILGTGGGFIFISRLLNYIDNLTLLTVIWILFFLLLSLFGFWAGKKNWDKQHGDLIKKIIEMKNIYSDNHDKFD